MRELPAPLGALAAYRQFNIYLTQPSRTRPGKTDKFPCDSSTGRVVDAHDPQYWVDSITAIEAAARFGETYGVGFVFTKDDPFWFLDIDNCLEDNDWSSLAKSLCSMFNGCAIEISQSGQGLHLIGTGVIPPHGCKNTKLNIEFYDSSRFCALTGQMAVGDAAFDATEILPNFIDTYFPSSTSHHTSQGWTTEPDPEWRGPIDDEVLIKRALASKSASATFGNAASFSDLWHASTELLSHRYPDENRPYDCSSADAALAQHLAFWTGKNCERIERIMRLSALAREKWDRADYLRRTILFATSRQFDVLTDKVKTKEPAVTSSAEMSNGNGYADIAAQIEMFKGCVYILDQHRVLTPGGRVMKQAQFETMYGGYTFVIDNANQKMAKTAWDAFTQNRAYKCPRVDGTCFRPDLPAGTIIKRDEMTFVNIYYPIEVTRKVGDVTPFLTHLAKVLPNERDRLILLSYMAACVQHKGFKFQWAPILQGVEGNGKTLFTRCVAEAVGRRYVHWPKASKLDKDFNYWMVGKLFFGVEDIYFPAQRREIIEHLKPMITGGDGIEIEAKGVNQISSDICGNFIFNTNHKDGIHKTKNDRRFCVLFSAQQDVHDLVRDGMHNDYFPKLYGWLHEGGYAIVSELLHTFPIPAEYNPATLCQRAPVTSSTEEAIKLGAGNVEQELKEAIEQRLPGFRDGWISSMQFDKLLLTINASQRMSRQKRKDLLEMMGYQPHPALPGGRVNNLVLPDGGKTVLFVHSSSPHAMIENASEVAHVYEESNNIFDISN